MENMWGERWIVGATTERTERISSVCGALFLFFFSILWCSCGGHPQDDLAKSGD
jgi:hypothetical protein